MKTLTVHIQDESKVEEIRAYLAQYGPVQEHPTAPERWEELPQALRDRLTLSMEQAERGEGKTWEAHLKERKEL